MLGSMRATTVEAATKGPAPARAGPPATSFDLGHGLPNCPFLRSRDGAWSSTHPSRDLRCWAVHPAAQPAVQKQRQLCVTADHASCATYGAAVFADPAGDRAADGAGLWPDASPLPVAIESVHVRSGRGIRTPRFGGQPILVGLMLVALLVLLIARANPLAGPVPSASPGASAGVASAGSSPSAFPTAMPSPTAVVTPSPAVPSPSAAPTRTPAPAASPRTYRVRSGDTIAGIAAKFHSTVKAIVAANNIADPRTIHPGQVLIIP